MYASAPRAVPQRYYCISRRGLFTAENGGSDQAFTNGSAILNTCPAVSHYERFVVLEAGVGGPARGAVGMTEATAWPARQRQLALLRAALAAPHAGPVFVSGPAATGKRAVVLAAAGSARVVGVDCVRCHSDRLLMAAVGDGVAGDLGALVDAVAGREGRVIIVLWRAERLKGGAFSAGVVGGVLRLAELSGRSDIRVVFVSRVAWGEFREVVDVDVPRPVCVYFGAYEEDELVDALSGMCDAGDVGAVPGDVAAALYPGFVKSVVGVLYCATTDLRELHRVCVDLYPTYLGHDLDKPIRTLEDVTPTVSSMLFNRTREPLKAALRKLYRRELVMPRAQTLTAEPPRMHRAVAPAAQVAGLDLSTSALRMLVAAFLAGHNPPKTDTKYFSAERTKRQRAAPKATGAFPLERLLAIFDAICDEDDEDGIATRDRRRRYVPAATGVSAALSTSSLVQISTLVSLNLLNRQGCGDPILEPKYRCNISYDTANHISRLLKLELCQYMHGE